MMSMFSHCPLQCHDMLSINVMFPRTQRRGLRTGAGTIPLAYAKLLAFLEGLLRKPSIGTTGTTIGTTLSLWSRGSRGILRRPPPPSRHPSGDWTSLASPIYLTKPTPVGQCPQLRLSKLRVYSQSQRDLCPCRSRCYRYQTILYPPLVNTVYF